MVVKEEIFVVNFEFMSPTKLYFGKDQEKRIGELIKERGAKKVLLQCRRAASSGSVLRYRCEVPPGSGSRLC